MTFILDNCYKIKDKKEINKYKKNKVVEMSGMFEECKELKYLDLSNFDTSKVESMTHMFLNCHKLKEIKGIDKFYKNKVKYNNRNKFEKSGQNSSYIEKKVSQPKEKIYNERITLGKKLLDEGIENLKKGEYKEARKKFEEAAVYLDKYVNRFIKEEKEGCELYQNLIINLCDVCHILKDYNAVIRYANFGIEIKEESPKLFYYRAIASAQILQFEQAEKDIKYLEKLLSNNGEKIEEIEYIRNIIINKKNELGNTINDIILIFTFHNTQSFLVNCQTNEKLSTIIDRFKNTQCPNNLKQFLDVPFIGKQILDKDKKLSEIGIINDETIFFAPAKKIEIEEDNGEQKEKYELIENKEEQIQNTIDECDKKQLMKQFLNLLNEFVGESIYNIKYDEEKISYFKLRQSITSINVNEHLKSISLYYFYFKLAMLFM